MNHQIVEARLKDIIITNIPIGISQAEIHEHTNIFRDFFLDSIQMVNIISDIEMEFGIELLSYPEIREILVDFSKLKEHILVVINI